MTTEVTVRPRLRVVERKSAAVSPTVVASTLMTQNIAVTSGTLLSMRLSREAVGSEVADMGSPW